MNRSLEKTHVRLLARDLLRLSPSPSDPTSFSLGSASVSRAETVGTVVSCDLTPKFLKFAVDDGTGCVTCMLWLNHLTSSYFSRWKPSTVSLVARAARDQAVKVRIGHVARVRGRITSYRGALQITVTVVVMERDPNAEILHWLECLTLARRCYRLVCN
ncbi:PREDICTED: CST complex subunit STN1 [Tarenaya hassleriana]|uniref:CST complex subunit STN1 n=1 Tax=Tarenaya hassleriana TaxID=28532 RepID=UPI00053CA21E|nr:PREDICTED: CST complex subunit STN1 [Tarenaya hassleriana]XP_019056614.1 PREDICTED: CST complex subunit STN1 [Tarenaya hassleriana]XP_019056615.1 PREDICTED: CST complex subunit STN1 [Tarenaya hassleriana]